MELIIFMKIEKLDTSTSEACKLNYADILKVAQWEFEPMQFLFVDGELRGDSRALWELVMTLAAKKSTRILMPRKSYGGFRRTVCRTQSWFFWPGKLLVPMTSLRQKMTGFMSPFRIYFHINNIPRQWKVMTVFSVERFPGPPLWRRFSLNWRTYPKIWKLVWKGLLPSFQKSIHCPRGTRSLPFQKNQDCFFSELSTLGG